LFWQQCAFLGHDLGHTSFTNSWRLDYLLMVTIFNAVNGISPGWWKRSHNVHHIITNSHNFDPDIQHLPVFAVSEKFFNNIFSKYHNRVLEFDNLSQIFLRYQHFLYYPIMGFARFNLYLQGLLLLLSSKKMHYRTTELISFIIFVSWVSYLVSALPNLYIQISWLLISHLIAGILHVQITLSHFSMPVYEGHNETEFFRTQVLGSMDIDCSTNMDWFHGGLQFQVEHHLFPRMPRYHLRNARPYVIQLCKKYEIPYTSVSFLEANKMVISTLRDVSQKLKNPSEDNKHLAEYSFKLFRESISNL